MRLEYFEILLENHLIREIECGIHEKKDFSSAFPGALETVKNDVIFRCLYKGKIEEVDTKLYLKRKTFKQSLDDLPESREKEILTMRIGGSTLEEIGNQFNLTRERVRQILARTMRRFPEVQEARESWIFENMT